MSETEHGFDKDQAQHSSSHSYKFNRQSNLFGDGLEYPIRGKVGVKCRNVIVESQSWLPELEYERNAVHEAEDADEYGFFEQLTLVMNTPKINVYGRFRLFYFEVRDVGEPLRLLLHYVDQRFEDVRISDATWTSEDRQRFPLNRLPVLEHDDFRVTGALPIARYLGHTFGLAGESHRENAKLDEAGELVLEAMGEFAPLALTLAGKSNHDPAHVLSSTVLPAAQRLLPVLSAALDSSRGPFLFGPTPKWPDFFLAELVCTLSTIASQLFVGFRNLTQHSDLVLGLDNVREYVRQRPQSLI